MFTLSYVYMFVRIHVFFRSNIVERFYFRFCQYIAFLPGLYQNVIKLVEPHLSISRSIVVE